MRQDAFRCRTKKEKGEGEAPRWLRRQFAGCQLLTWSEKVPRSDLRKCVGAAGSVKARGAVSNAIEIFREESGTSRGVPLRQLCLGESGRCIDGADLHMHEAGQLEGDLAERERIDPFRPRARL